MLVIGDGFPSWSQVANPTSPEMVRERLGVETVELGIERLFEEYEKADRAAAERIAREWLEGAREVTEGARQDIVEIGRVHLALEKLLSETDAQAITVDCRLWDEENIERFGRFYSPCMPFTIFRWKGIPAACEADVNALLSMLILGYLADRPTFMGNVGRVGPQEGWVDVAHCAATLNMDGIGATPEPYIMVDYHTRGTGIASHSDMTVGQVVTVARLDKDLQNISAIAGPILECEAGPGCLNRIRVQTSGVLDYMHNCLTGDHQAVVYGDVRPELRLLGRQLGFGVLEPKGVGADVPAGR
jgi:L-fucose isomerase-like protein